jgi:glycosyltransferase involved in cell wall biosynthesis
MRVLWFEVTVPKSYSPHHFQGAGWQDALAQIVKSRDGIDLGVAFESKHGSNEKREIDGVHYFPIRPNYSYIEKLKNKISWQVSRNKLIPLSMQVIEEFKPDVIHVFGSEWCFGQVAELTDIPVVIHMQGSIPPYLNAFYPPGYNIWDEVIFSLVHFKWRNLYRLPMDWQKRKTCKAQEEKTLSIVHNYMGRTEWDKGLINIYHPDANYFYCSEALRNAFTQTTETWMPPKNKKLILTTVGCSTFWKGLDTIVRTARLLKERNVDFEWCLVGSIGNKELIEWKEKTKMTDVNIQLVGMLEPNALINQLMQTNIYIHTAYIDNSPNSVCEAQYLGVPIIATYVGGIPSLIENKVDGLLVPANDPYTLANNILKLTENKDQQLRYSENAQKRARERHKPERIKVDLLKTYNAIIKH